MKLSFRWFGENDPVKLEYIRQIPNMRSIVSAVYDVKPGERWGRESVAHIKERAEQNGLIFDVVESVPVHEDIKLGKPKRDKYIEAYIANIRLLAEYGVKCVCYNFMPVFDWTRTQLDYKNIDGSTSLVFFKEQADKMNPMKSEISLPGWDSSYQKDETKRLFAEYESVDEERLFENLEYFLKAVIPVAEECDVRMAIHPDDPPWNIFGLPRIIKNEKNIDRFLSLYNSEYNGLTLCTGSLGCSRENDVPRLTEKYVAMKRVHFMHVRNVLISGSDFRETAHFSDCGSLDIVAILRALYENGFDGYIRPDHGRMIFGETGRAGYGIYDRALGAAYLNGIWETLMKIGGLR